MTSFVSIEQAVPLLGWWRRAPKLPASGAQSVRDIGIAIERPSLLPTGEPVGDAPAAVQMAHLLRERIEHNRRSEAIAVVPGHVATDFADRYPATQPALWVAVSGPTECMRFDRPGDAVDGSELLVDRDARQAELLRVRALGAVLAHARDFGPLVWQLDDSTGVSWAKIHDKVNDRGETYHFQGALAVRDGTVLRERGFYRPGDSRLAVVSWLVVWRQAKSGEVGIRLTGLQIETLAPVIALERS